MAGKNLDLTLTLDADLLQEAQAYAAKKETSVDQLVREYLQALVKHEEERTRREEEHAGNVQALRDLMVRGIPGLKVERLDREAIYAERLDRWIR